MSRRDRGWGMRRDPPRATVSLLTPACGVKAPGSARVCFLALLIVLGRGPRRLSCPSEAPKWSAAGGRLLSLAQDLDHKIPNDFETSIYEFMRGLNDS